MSTGDQRLHEYPAHDPLAGVVSGHEYRASSTGVTVKLDILLNHIWKQRTARQDEDYRRQLGVLAQTIHELQFLMTQLPEAAQGADIALDIGRAAQKLGMWEALEAVKREEHRKEQQKRKRRKRAEDRKRGARRLYREFSRTLPNLPQGEMNKKIGEELGVSARTIRNYLKDLS